MGLFFMFEFLFGCVDIAGIFWHQMLMPAASVEVWFQFALVINILMQFGCIEKVKGDLLCQPRIQGILPPTSAKMTLQRDVRMSIIYST